MDTTAMSLPTLDRSAEEVDGRLPVDPLLEHLGPNWAADARQRGADEVEVATLLRALNRGRDSGGLTPRAADRLAVRAAGLHPSLIWGQIWWSGAGCGGPKHCTEAECCEPDDGDMVIDLRDDTVIDLTGSCDDTSLAATGAAAVTVHHDEVCG